MQTGRPREPPELTEDERRQLGQWARRQGPCQSPRSKAKLDGHLDDEVGGLLARSLWQPRACSLNRSAMIHSTFGRSVRMAACRQAPGPRPALPPKGCGGAKHAGAMPGELGRPVRATRPLGWFDAALCAMIRGGADRAGANRGARLDEQAREGGEGRRHLVDGRPGDSRRGLRFYGEKGMRPHVQQALADPRWHVRRGACGAIRFMEKDTRANAAEALKTRAASAASHLRAMLRDAGDNKEKKDCLQSVLEAIGGKG